MAHYPQYDTVQRYPAEQTIGYTSTAAEWGIFSNFAKSPMVVNGIEFACVEQLYHYIRLNNEVERVEYLKLTPNMGLKMKAKAFKKRGIERSDWKEIAVDVMRFCLNHKYQASAEFRKALADSGDRFIVEDESNRKKRPDSWGAVFDTATGEYYGKNIMGRLLMELREKGQLDYTEFVFYASRCCCMNKLQYIQEQLLDAKLREALAEVVADVGALIPQSEEEFMELQKFGLYPVEECIPFVTKQGTPFYQLDNMAMVPRGETSCYLHYGDFVFRQLEVLYIMARMDSAEAHNWLKDNLFQGCRVDARKKTEYKAKFKEHHRKDWKQIQTEWMKYCLMLKYRHNALFRKDLFACRGKLPVEDATGTSYASNLFWGAKLIELDGKRYYFGCNVLGKLLTQLRDNGGKLDYKLPKDLHLFGKPIIKL